MTEFKKGAIYGIYEMLNSNAFPYCDWEEIDYIFAKCNITCEDFSEVGFCDNDFCEMIEDELQDL